MVTQRSTLDSSGGMKINDHELKLQLDAKITMNEVNWLCEAMRRYRSRELKDLTEMMRTLHRTGLTM